jgi:hypothetical protein
MPPRLLMLMTAPARSGKDAIFAAFQYAMTASAAGSRDVGPVCRYASADVLRDVVSRLTGVSVAQMSEPHLKNEVIPELGVSGVRNVRERFLGFYERGMFDNERQNILTPHQRDFRVSRATHPWLGNEQRSVALEQSRASVFLPHSRPDSRRSGWLEDPPIRVTAKQQAQRREDHSRDVLILAWELQDGLPNVRHAHQGLYVLPGILRSMRTCMTDPPDRLLKRDDAGLSKDLNLWGMNLQGPLTPLVRCFTSLTALNVSYNQLTALPSVIGALTALRHLDVSDGAAFGDRRPHRTHVPQRDPQPADGAAFGNRRPHRTHVPLRVRKPVDGAAFGHRRPHCTQAPHRFQPADGAAFGDRRPHRTHGTRPLTALPSAIGALTALTTLDVSATS